MEGLVSLLALLYVVLAARNNPWCWGFGALACLGWAYLDVMYYALYSDALLQVFYIGMSVWGYFSWRAARQAPSRPIARMSKIDHFLLLAFGSLSGLLLGYTVSSFLPAAATYWDALTTTFSVGATVFLLKRKLENWAYWVVIDLAYVGIYFSRGAWLLAALMLVYTAVAVYGYCEWKRQWASAQMLRA
ncbi:MAG: nicotinamide mononucleotide transporter [Lewinella sp.]|nr:nicotinamide mononucleotide transporter [Lewinella sp.]